MTTVGIIGSTGFVGRQIVAAAERAGHTIMRAPPPRLRVPPAPTQVAPATSARSYVPEVVASLRGLQGADVIINAAGLSAPTSRDQARMFAVNTILPGALAASLEDLGIPRLVHVSSAAVWGTGVLDESLPPMPLTPYARSKLAGDTLVAQMRPKGCQAVIYRPTSVHGRDRHITAAVSRLARSPLASVASDGTDHTPQVLAENVGTAALF